MQQLGPVFAVYPWFPDERVGGDRARRLLDQALFARTVSAASATETPHSLEADTYARKASHTLTAREAGLEEVTLAWKAVGIGSAVVAYLSVWLLCRAMTVLRFHAYVFFPVAFVVFAIAIGTQALSPSVSDTADGYAASKTRGGGGVLGGDWGGGGTVPAETSGKININGIGDGSVRALIGRPRDWAPLSPEEANALASIVSGQKARLRQWFPETLLWRPQLITDDRGRYTLDIPLADSITTWRLSAQPSLLTAASAAAVQTSASFSRSSSISTYPCR